MKIDAQLQDEDVGSWGNVGRGSSRVARPLDSSELLALFAEARALETTVGLRGAGTAWGDAAINSGAIVADMSRMNRILACNEVTGQITVEPGVTFSQLWQRTLPSGWWPAVAPEFSAMTIGGAAAVNIAGKGSWRSGLFSSSVLAVELMLPGGKLVLCDHERQPDLFAAALGGLGLFGCFTQLTLQLKKLASGDVWEIESRYGSLADLLEAVTETETWADTLVASLDPRATGRALGRGVLRAARDLVPDEEPHPEVTRTVAHQLRRQNALTSMADAMYNALPQPLGGALSRRHAWHHGHGIGLRRPHLQSRAAATFTFDAFAKRQHTLYPAGAVRHECFLPSAVAADVIAALLTHARGAGVVPALALLKRQRTGECLLDVERDGYSLTLDLPLIAGQEERTLTVVRELNDLVLQARGAVALSADMTLTPAQAQRMLGVDRLTRFGALKEICDPGHLLASDLYRRVLAPAAKAAERGAGHASKSTKAHVSASAVPATVGGVRRARGKGRH